MRSDRIAQLIELSTPQVYIDEKGVEQISPAFISYKEVKILLKFLNSKKLRREDNLAWFKTHYYRYTVDDNYWRGSGFGKGISAYPKRVKKVFKRMKNWNDYLKGKI